MSKRLDKLDSTGPQDLPDDADGDPRVFAAVQEYLTAVEAGQRPSRREFIARHPEIAGELAVCLEGLAFVNAAAGEIADDSARSQQPPVKRAPEIDLSEAQPLGDFQLIQEIGRGGMGTVFEAVQLSLGRRVAVKVLSMASALDSKNLERFRKEAQAAAQLHHTNIVPVYAVGCERSVHFYAMELIDGQSLADVIRDLQKLAQPNGAIDYQLPGQSMMINLSTMRNTRGAAYSQSVAKLGVQVSEALEYAHRAGVVHRDIKPANLLLDARGQLWITDFGLAQFYSDTNLTRSGDMVGTLRYMSPEQASGRAVVLDQRTDIYSLGVTLYEMLTLEHAVPGRTHEELLHQLTFHEPRAPRSIDKTIPKELETILNKSMAKEPGDRYQTAGALADDLRRFLHDEPILARPPTVVDKAMRWSRRHRAIVASTFIFLVIAAIGLCISTALIAREQARTNDAYEQERTKAIEANVQRSLAEKSGRQARQAVEFFSRIATDEMNGPQMAEVRREMLEESLAYFESFLEEGSGSAAVSAELDAARTKVAGFLQEFVALDGDLRAQARERLLSDASVLKDLQLTGDQVRPLLLDSANMPPPDDDYLAFHRLSSAQKAGRFLMREKTTEGEIEKVIGPVKAVRLIQIQRQVRSPLAFSDRDVMNQLAMTPEQITKVHAIQSQYRNARMEPTPFEDSTATQKLKLAATNNILAILTPAQVDGWKLLTGDPFTGSVHTGDTDGGPGWGHGPPHERHDHPSDFGPPNSQ